jgi:UDP-N-acetyl-D-mannosaminuronic acid dehydrogenase
MNPINPTNPTNSINSRNSTNSTNSINPSASAPLHKVCVLGLGYIGLPTASILATHGFEVVGVDVNPQVLKAISQGNSHIEEPGLETLVTAAVRSGHLRVKTTPEEADAFIIAVPTPLTDGKKADLSYVELATRSILSVLQTHNLVILESTVPPGTTRDVVRPILEESGLAVGEDFFVAHCPERVLPGKILKEIVQNNRIIGGLNPQSAERAKELYGKFVEGEIILTDATAAEMAKLAENTYRDVNIALANELSRICAKLNINVWEVIEMANKHPRVNFHKPGPGVGGHCIAIDPWFIVEKAPEEAKLICMARQVNDAQPEYVFQVIQEMIAGIQSPKVAVLGVAYKGDVNDTRESPALKVIDLLRENGYQVAVHDPHVHASELELVSLEEALQDADCAVILTDHSKFGNLKPQELGSMMRKQQLLDARHAINLEKWRLAGFQAKSLGDIHL